MVPIVWTLEKGVSSVGAFFYGHIVIKKVSIITTASYQKQNNRFAIEKTCNKKP